MINSVILFLSEQLTELSYENYIGIGIFSVFFGLPILLFSLVFYQIPDTKILSRNVNILFIVLIYLDTALALLKFEIYTIIYIEIFILVLINLFLKKYLFEFLSSYILSVFLVIFIILWISETYAIAIIYCITMIYLIALFYKRILILLVLLSIITMLFLARFYDIYLFDRFYYLISMFGSSVLFIIAIIRLCMYCFKKIRNRLHSKNKVDKNDFFIK